MMKKLLALSLMFGVGLTSAHAFMIDDFSTGAIDLQLTPPNTYLSGSRTGTMAGGLAVHSIRFLSNPDDNSARFRVNLNSGLQMVANEDLVATQSVATYGTDANGGLGNDLNLNLSGMDRFRLTFRSNDLPVSLNTIVYNAESSYSAVNYQQVVAAGTNVTVDVLFSNLGGYNFADLDAVTFAFDSSASGDFALTSIEAVPEPATLAILGIGTAALIRRRRR